MIELSIPLHHPSFPSCPLDVTLPCHPPLLLPTRKFVRPIRGKTFPTLHSCNTKFQNGVILKILKTIMSPPLKNLKMSKFTFAKPQQFLFTTSVLQVQFTWYTVLLLAFRF